MSNALRLYMHYLSQSIRSQMQYRTSFIMLSFGQFLATGIEFLAIASLFARFKHIQGWNLPEVAFLYGLINISFSFADAASRGFDIFSTMVKSGDFDRLLLRPRSTALQLAGHELTLRRVGRLIQGLAVFSWASYTLDISWSAPKIYLVLIAIFGGACLFIGLMVIQATIAFWTTESLELMNTLTYGGVETAQYPLPIYRTYFRKFFTYIVPLACVNYLPALAILERGDPLGFPIALQWCAPLICVIFLVVALQIWKIGVRHYRSPGS